MEVDDNYNKILTPEDFSVEIKDAKEKKTAVKRPRCDNWSDVDKELLKDLVQQKVKKVENKNTDTNTNKEKKKAWQEILKDFNSLCSCQHRTVEQLRSQWSTIKMQAKKEAANFRLKAKQTGGGEAPPEIPISGSDISVWLPNEFVIDTNEFDSDVVFINDESQLENPGIAQIEQVEEITEKQEVQKIEDETKRKTTPYKRKKFAPEKSVTEETILKVATTDVDCRKELHLLQMEAEKKRIRNLDLEFELLQAKLDYFKRNKVATFAV